MEIRPMIKESTAEKILDYIASHGGDFGEVFCEDTDYTRLFMSGGSLSEALAGRESGTGIRIFEGNSCTYLSCAGCGEEQLFRLLKESWTPGKGCAAESKTAEGFMEHAAGNSVARVPEKTSGLSKHCAEKTGEENCGRKAPASFPKPRTGKTVSTEEKLSLLSRCSRAGLAFDSRITRINARYTDSDQRVFIANTEGLSAFDRREKTRLHLTAFAEEGGEVRTSYIGPGAMRGFEFYEMNRPEDWAAQAAKGAVQMLHSIPCPTGRMPVVIANGFGGLFFHEACGHSLEACAVLDGASEFAGKLGLPVASEKVTLIDDGSLPSEWGSCLMDDEGVPAQKNVLIENGILKGYLTDRLSARRMNLTPTGSGRRQSYRFAPTSRMTNTYIAPGTDRLEDMISSIGQGIFVKSINAGSVNPSTGEFNFNTSETFLIENGRITRPVHSATLIGTGSGILRRVEMVGNDFKLGQGFCYAASGAIYIGAGQPAVKISEMTVGGDQA